MSNIGEFIKKNKIATAVAAGATLAAIGSPFGIGILAGTAVYAITKDDNKEKEDHNKDEK